MAAGDGRAASLTNGTHDSTKPIELAISLPSNPGARVHLHFTILAASIILFITSAGIDGGTAGAALGSFVYAMPDVRILALRLKVHANVCAKRYNPSQPLSTPLYSSPSSLDLTTRMAKLLARRTQRPSYVGGSINLANAAGGGTVEEEMEAFRAVVDVVTTEVAKGSDLGNGQ